MYVYVLAANCYFGHKLRAGQSEKCYRGNGRERWNEGHWWMKNQCHYIQIRQCS